MMRQDTDVSSWQGTPPNVSATRAGAVQQRLRKSAYFPLHDVHCTSHAGTLVLSGRVPSYYMKQLAQEVACTTDGVSTVVNQVEVD